MYAKVVKLINETGLHARPASQFVNEAKGFKSKITVKKAGTDAAPADAKSIILLLSLAISAGTEIEIAAEGEDEVQAVDTLAQLVESGFGE